jgi:hypothetical protein
MIVLTRLALLRVPAIANSLRQMNQGVLSPAAECLSEIPAALSLLLGPLIMARIEKRRLADYGLSLRGPVAKWLLWGTGWGLGNTSVTICSDLAAGILARRSRTPWMRP